MARDCASFLATGACTKPNCAERHVRVCTVCEVVCNSNENFDSHLNGKQHRFRAGGGAKGGRQPIWCEACNQPLKGTKAAYEYHLQTPYHLKAVEDFVQPGTAGAQENSKFCAVCNVDVKANRWGKHTQSPRHKRKADFAVYHAALANAQKNRNGVVVNPDTIDYGVVEVDSLSHTPEIVKTFQIAAESRVVVRDVQFHSALHKSRKRPYVPSFSVRGVVSNTLVVARSPMTVSVTFSPRGRRGRYHDSLQITFEDSYSGKEFTIVRPLMAIVTEGEDFHLLQPIAPYRPKEKREPVEDSEVVPGPKPPALSDIVWKYRLPLALIPAELKKTLREIQDRPYDVQRGVLLSRNLVPYGPLSLTNYGRMFKSLLWIEEDRLSADLQQFDMEGQEFKQVGDRFVLAVPGLSEGRPSVLVGDRIIARAMGRPAQEKWFQGSVFAIRLEDVELKFALPFEREWQRGMKFNVRFTLNRLPLRRMHQALEMPSPPARILFPTLYHIRVISPRERTVAEARQLRPGNRRIAQNPAQREAVTSILNLPLGSAPFVVFGPPGTGKTVTIVEAMRQLTLRDPTMHILACAPSNSAADLLAERLIGEGMNLRQLFRLNAPSRSKDHVPKKLLPFSRLNNQGTFAVPPVEDLSSYTVVVSTCSTASVPYNLGVRPGHFSYIFVDEVGQAMEPEALIALRTMGDASTRLVISGDPKQLGPIVHSPIAENMEPRQSGRHLGLGWSYLDRVMERDAYAEAWRGVSWVKLLKNWRSHESILKYPNEAFYGDELEACADPAVTRSLLRFEMLPNPQFPVIFHGLVGKDERESQSPSYFNRDEASLVKKYVVELLQDKRLAIKDSDIGIIAPYSAQCTKIRQLIRKHFPMANIKVGSVEEFQGQERRVIIISAVRSNPDLVVSDVRQALGFVKNPRRFNVAITRAQALLVVIGNPDILMADENWMRFMSYIHRNDGWEGLEPDWDTRQPTDGTGWRQVLERALADAEERQQSAREQTMVALGSLAAADEINAGVPPDERGANTTWRDAI